LGAAICVIDDHSGKFAHRINFLIAIFTYDCYSQPGCVNTTEMDIRKCRRLKNPQRVKKVLMLY